MKKKVLSIIVPCLNEEECLPLFYKEINNIQEIFLKENINLELIFVDDGSNDNTLNVIKKIKNNNNFIHYISFSKNFGKEAAIYAGLKKASGDLVALMDADLQHPPKLLIDMYNEIKETNYDIVIARRKNRKGEPVIKSFFAEMFYKLITKISKVKVDSRERDFRLMTRQVVDAILSMPEYNRYSKGLFSYLGFKTKWISFDNVKRVAGETKWSFGKLLLYAFDAIIGFSTVPLMISTFLGILFCFISFILILVIIFKTIIFGDPVSGWPSLVCIIFFVSGIQLFCLGICSAYISKIYLETKNRPLYIVKESDIDEKEADKL